MCRHGLQTVARWMGRHGLQTVARRQRRPHCCRCRQRGGARRAGVCAGQRWSHHRQCPLLQTAPQAASWQRQSQCSWGSRPTARICRAVGQLATHLAALQLAQLKQQLMWHHQLLVRLAAPAPLAT